MKKFRGLVILLLVAVLSMAIMACDPTDDPGKKDDPPGKTPEQIASEQRVSAFIDAVAQLPTLANLKLEDKAKVANANNIQYAALNADEKKLTTVIMAFNTLDTLNQRILVLEAEAADTKIVDFLAAVTALPAVGAVAIENEAKVLELLGQWNEVGYFTSAEKNDRVDMIAAGAKLNSLKDRIDVLKAEKALADAKTALLAKLSTEFAKYSQSAYETADWTELKGYYDEAVATVNGFEIIQDVTDYDIATVDDLIPCRAVLFANMANVVTIAKLLQEDKEKMLTRINAAQSEFIRINYAQENWGDLLGIFEDAKAEIIASSSRNFVNNYSVTALRAAAQLIETLDPYGDGTQVAANGQIRVSTNGADLEMGRGANNSDARFFGLYDDVDYLLIKVYEKHLNTATLTYSSEWSFAFASEFRWTWNNRTQNSVAPAPPNPDATGTALTNWQNSGTLTATTITGDTYRVYGGTTDAANTVYTAISASGITLLQNLLGTARYNADAAGDVRYGVSATLVPKMSEEQTTGSSLESNIINSDNNAWGRTHADIVAATTTLNGLIDAVGAVGDMAYTQAKFTALDNATKALDALSPIQFTLVDIARVNRLNDELWPAFEGVELTAVQAFVNQVPTQTTINGINNTMPIDDLIEFMLDVVDLQNFLEANRILAYTQNVSFKSTFDAQKTLLSNAMTKVLSCMSDDDRREALFKLAMDAIGDIIDVSVTGLKARITEAKNQYADLSADSKAKQKIKDLKTVLDNKDRLYTIDEGRVKLPSGADPGGTSNSNVLFRVSTNGFELCRGTSAPYITEVMYVRGVQVAVYRGSATNALIASGDEKPLGYFWIVYNIWANASPWGQMRMSQNPQDVNAYPVTGNFTTISGEPNPAFLNSMGAVNDMYHDGISNTANNAGFQRLISRTTGLIWENRMDFKFTARYVAFPPESNSKYKTGDWSLITNAKSVLYTAS